MTRSRFVLRPRTEPGSGSPTWTRKLEKELDLAAHETEGLLAAARPLARWLNTRRERRTEPLVVGISGAQGSGKSTFCSVLATVLRKGHGLRACIVSIDDLYLTRAERRQLAAEVHPLLATRGVPGTHDVFLGQSLFDRLLGMEKDDEVAIPKFSKALDDRLPEPQWTTWADRPDLVLFEGWCVGIGPQADAELEKPINSLEAGEDPDGTWRRHVNHRLHTTYARLFTRLDVLIFLQVPDFDSVLRWRLLQEEKLTRRHPGAPQRMGPVALERFIAHYERLTLHAFATLPDRADVVCQIDSEHRIVEIVSREALPTRPRSPSPDP